MPRKKKQTEETLSTSPSKTTTKKTTKKKATTSKSSTTLKSKSSASKSAKATKSTSSTKSNKTKSSTAKTTKKSSSSQTKAKKTTTRRASSKKTTKSTKSTKLAKTKTSKKSVVDTIFEGSVIPKKEKIEQKTTYDTIEVSQDTFGLDPFSAPPDYDYDYGLNRVVLLPIDPKFAFVYWEVQPYVLEQAFHNKEGVLVLRFYDVTNIVFNGFNAHEIWDVQVFGHRGTWYVKHSRGDRILMVELGVLEPNGVFNPIIRSNTTYFPADFPSMNDKVIWMTVDEFGNKVLSEVEYLTEEDLKLLNWLYDKLFIVAPDGGMRLNSSFFKVKEEKQRIFELIFEMPSSANLSSSSVSSSFFKSNI